jgi:Kef-type K+ transport system membrane component KefB
MKGGNLMEIKNTKLNEDIACVFVVTALILMVPLVAMQFTLEVNWDITDFIVMGTLLSSVGLLIMLAKRTVKNTNHRVVVILALLAAFLLIWAHLAVGIVDTWPFAGS